MPVRSKGHQQRLDREARFSAIIGIICAVIFLVSAHFIARFGQALQWVVAAGSAVGLSASLVTSYFMYESAVCVKASMIAYGVVCGAGLIIFLMAR